MGLLHRPKSGSQWSSTELRQQRVCNKAFPEPVEGRLLFEVSLPATNERGLP